MDGDAEEDNTAALEDRIVHAQEDLKYCQSVPEERRQAVFNGTYDNKIAELKAVIERLQERKWATKSLS
eukprot:6794280-Karenia_brevis.AAC.1